MYIVGPDLLHGNKAMGGIQELNLKYINPTQTSACVTAGNVLLAKTIYMAKRNLRKEAHSTYHEVQASYWLRSILMK